MTAWVSAASNSLNQLAVRDTPCSMAKGNGPQILSVSAISNVYSVKILRTRKEFNGNVFNPIQFRMSPPTPRRRATTTGTLRGGLAPNASANWLIHLVSESRS